MRAESRETAALWRAAAGLREAEFGNPAAARQNADAALSLSSGPDVKLLAALTLARAGDTATARRLVEQLERTPSTNTMLKIYCLPTIDAAIEISNALAGDAGKARAAYQDFSILWKDADPDIPILGEAKAEYVRLQ
jgi:hypothetical protein